MDRDPVHSCFMGFMTSVLCARHFFSSFEIIKPLRMCEHFNFSYSCKNHLQEYDSHQPATNRKDSLTLSIKMHATTVKRNTREIVFNYRQGYKARENRIRQQQAMIGNPWSYVSWPVQLSFWIMFVSSACLQYVAMVCGAQKSRQY